MSWHRTCRLAICLSALVAVTGCGDDDHQTPAPTDALIVVSPHPDDESIFGGATIHRLAADPNRYVRAVYVSGGDRAGTAGDCNGIPEDEKRRRIVELREQETRAAWAVLAPEREVPLGFMRGLDQGLVESSTMENGIRHDVLSPDGARALAGAAAFAQDVPRSVRRVLILTTSLYDGHPDHRVAYRAARQAAEFLHEQRGAEVRLWSWIIHDEVARVDVPTCCVGDFHWPANGPTNDHLSLTDTVLRPRPPMWNHVEDVSELVELRRQALAQHVSQVVGYPALCMSVYIPSFYARWMEKLEEPFYEEIL
jgi:LmbE family N-acetylglucosaminyl deacetylase